MIKTLESLRKQTSRAVAPAKKSELGQFLTPTPVAEFMASLFDEPKSVTRLLDPGAGIGSLSAAFLQQYQNWNCDLSKLTITAYELDGFIERELEQVFGSLSAVYDASFKVENSDFVEDAAHKILFERNRPFTHAIMNPPYKKINSDSRHRSLLRSVGIETVNLYSAFTALSLELLADGGQLVAILPRSFCNGPYYKSFRERLFSKSSIRHIHLFGSRNKTFKEDSVLQENIIISVERAGVQKDVIISTSTDGTFVDYTARPVAFERIRYPDDPESFIHIPTSDEIDFHENSSVFSFLLSDLFLEVSTGPIVDFRMKSLTSAEPANDSVPLLYPGHFRTGKLVWPRLNWKKPNAIKLTDETARFLFPTGFYTVVKRFSSKEEVRRIQASIVEPNDFADYTSVGFENHFNVYHFRKHGIAESLARGLAVFLNSTPVDRYFRRMNGHTQVNATDLRRLRYPSRDILTTLGELAIDKNISDQGAVDELLTSVTK